MSRTNTILRNVAANWVGFAVNAAVTLALTPIVLRYLGTGKYGVWILTSSVIGYYGLLDLGFRAGVTQYLMRYFAVGDNAKVSECVSTAVAALAALGVALTVLSIGAALLAPDLFQIPPEAEREAFWCILIVGCTSAVSFVFTPFMSIFMAAQRFDLANLIGIGTRLLTAAAIVVAVQVDSGLIGVSVATCSLNLVDYLIRWRVAYRLSPQLQVTRSAVSRERLREIASFASWSFLISLNAYLYQHGPTLLLGVLMPIAAVGYYSLASGLIRQIGSLLNPVSQVFYPAATNIHAQGDREALERLYQDGSRLLILLTVTVAVVSAFWAEDFYRLWIGEEYLGESPFDSVALLFQIMLVGTMTSCFSSIGGQVLSSAGHVRPLAITLVAGSILMVIVSLLLIRPYGLKGMAMSTVVSSMLVDIVTIPFLLQRTLGFSVKAFLRTACLRPAVVGLLLIVTMTIIRLAGRADSWSELIVQVVFAGVGSIALVATVGLTKGERERFLLRPLGRVLRR